MQDCAAPITAVHVIARQLAHQHALQTQPFLQLVAEYGSSLQHAREVQVRAAQLDKEAAELRDEVRALHERLLAADEAKAAEWRSQAETATAQARRLTEELEQATRERDFLRQQVTTLSDERRELEATHTSTVHELEQVSDEAARLREALTQTSAALEREQAAREAAASEVQGALAAREAALVEVERLRGDNMALSRRLVQLKEQEIERMNEINRMHEEMMAQAAAMKREADADREAAHLIRNKAGIMAAATLQAAAAAVGLGHAPPRTSGGGTEGGVAGEGAAAAGQQGQHTTAPVPSGGSGSGSGGSNPGAGGWRPVSTPFKTGGFTAPSVLGRMFGRHTPTPPPAPGRPSSGAGTAPERTSSVSAGGGGGSAGGAGEQLQPGPSITSTASAWDMVSGGGGASGTDLEAAAAAAVAAGGVAPVGLAELMGVPPPGVLAGGGNDTDRSLPRAPYRSVVAHRGGCCALAMQSPGAAHTQGAGQDTVTNERTNEQGVRVTLQTKEAEHPQRANHTACHLMASCGLDRPVALWDLTVMRSNAGPHQHLHGMAGGVNSVAFTADGAQVLGAGADKSLHLWSVSSGSVRHTLTGHAGSVVAVAASPLDVRCAASVGEDRSLRLWDLARGFSVHSVGCAKMPNAIAMSRDANTIATGHLDGVVCLWDVRQCWAGSSTPLAESRIGTSLIISLSPGAGDSALLLGSKDGSVMLWDFRMQAVVQSLRAPRFNPGTQGSSGRGRCHMSASPDGRWVAAGGADGGVYVWDLHAGSTSGGAGSATSPVHGPGLGGGSPGGAGPAGGPRVSVLSHHKDAVVATAWSADASVLATADKAGVVALWSLLGITAGEF